jgi:pilus assembly protein CpaB
MTAYSQVESVPQPVRPASRTAQKARTRALVALSVALVAGLGASWLIFRAIQNQPEPSAAVPMRKVVTTKLELPVATTLTVEMLAVAEWPEGATPAGAFDEPEEVVGRVLRTGVVPGDAIVEARLAPKEGGRGLAAMIPPGHRAMTVRVNESSGVAGFVHPGDLVDVVATSRCSPSGRSCRRGARGRCRCRS